MQKDGADAIILSLGKWGRWQISQCILLALTNIPLALQYTSIVFMGYEPDFRCLGVRDGINTSQSLLGNDGNVSDVIEGKQCDVWDDSSNSSRPCERGYEYSSDEQISIVSQWDLVCGHSYLVHTSQTILSAGMMVGYLTLPLSDRFGRKRTMVIFHWLLLVLGIATAFSPNMIFFVIMKFLIGCVFPGVNITMCMMALELFPTDQRAVVAMLSKFIWASGIMLAPLMAFIFRSISWRYLQLALSAFSLIVILHTFITEESIRWLLVMNRKCQAIEILKRAARFNKIDYSSQVQDWVQTFSDVHSVTIAGSNQELQILASEDGVIDKQMVTPHLSNNGHSVTEPALKENMECPKSKLDSQADLEQTQMLTEYPGDQDITEKANILTLFRHAKLRRYVFICTYMLTVDVMLYYGLLLMSSSLTGDRFLNVFMSGAVEIPGYILCMVTLDRFGRKICNLAFHIFAGGMLVLAVIINTTQGPDLLVTALTTLGKFGSSGTLIVTFLHTSELLPTNVRGLGIGLTGCIAHIGALLAPLSSFLVQYGVWLPGTIFSVCCVTVCAALFFLPETKGRQLPQAVTDLDKWDTSTRTIRNIVK